MDDMRRHHECKRINAVKRNRKSEASVKERGLNYTFFSRTRKRALPRNSGLVAKIVAKIVK